jgi:hypothetical protein
MSKTVGVLSILEGPLLDEAVRLWKLFETNYHSQRASATRATMIPHAGRSSAASTWPSGAKTAVASRSRTVILRR